MIVRAAKIRIPGEKEGVEHERPERSHRRPERREQEPDWKPDGSEKLRAAAEQIRGR